MNPAIAVGIMVALAIVALALMLWGWRRRVRRDTDVAVPLGAAAGSPIFSGDGLYVATTRHDDPLNRVVAPPLAFRSRASVAVTDAGLALELAGEPTVFIPADRLVGAGRATWTIDRVVERDGLVLTAWSDGTHLFDTYIRLQDDDPARLVAAIEQIASADSSQGARQ